MTFFLPRLPTWRISERQHKCYCQTFHNWSKAFPQNSLLGVCVVLWSSAWFTGQLPTTY